MIRARAKAELEDLGSGMGVSDLGEQRLIGQIEHVKKLQKRLESALQWLKDNDSEWIHQRAIDLEQECRGQVLLLQVTGKIHEKIQKCQESLLRAGKAARSVPTLQKRLGELENDLDHVLSQGKIYKSLSEESTCSKLSTDEGASTLSGTRLSSSVSQHPYWRSLRGSAYQKEEKQNFLRQPKELGAQIGRDDKQVWEDELQWQRLSSHQNPWQIFPMDPSVWRRTSIDFSIVHPRVVCQPSLVDESPGSFYKTKQRMKGEIKKQRLSPRLHWTSFASSQQSRVIDRKKDPLKWQRLKDLSECLMLTPREQDQVDAAKALGYLGYKNEFVVSALCQTLQVNRLLSVRYETVKALTLLGCLQAAVVKELVGYLRRGSEELLMDILTTLKITLQKRCQAPRAQGDSLEDLHGLTRALVQLVTTRGHLDNISLEAAICLAHLEARNKSALSILRSYLSHKNLKKRMKAVRTLVMCIQVHDAAAIQGTLDQISQSEVFKHRIEASYFLVIIGLQQIKQEGLEGKVFDLLREKLYKDPLLVVRRAVALTVENLQMKKLMWDTIEKQLKEESEVSRIQAVLSLGVLGIRNRLVLRHLVEMLDMDQSKEVRIQIIRLICLLRLKDPYILRKLKFKEKGEEPLASEATKALQNLQRIASPKNLYEGGSDSGL
ncbi:protein HEATR9 isoform X1 [Rhinatrema bivittatum]|uniref:protein HEATR9 isoform X1 n=1 Tax=Rhinatrema bivittatum TaxID=194408 RepID=UPI00112E6C6D|nr:protein HEATR9 isoform X1 [Rhinatrema bivittatum]